MMPSGIRGWRKFAVRKGFRDLDDVTLIQELRRSGKEDAKEEA